MLKARSSRITTLMIYLGTFLVSVLSFFTTFQGLKLFLDYELALIGSLGLQAAMLGIAWNLMRLRDNRTIYTLVFACAAVFSIFFSYVNFNTRLKESTRIQTARADYTEAAAPIMREFSTLARAALSHSQYQDQRVAHLLQMEEAHGWATVVDEGSNDPFIQEIIDGARRTVESWQTHQGTDYRQGSGKGIITNYLSSWQEQVQHNYDAVATYVTTTDSLALLVQADLPVASQYDLVNRASVHFPVAEYTSILGHPPTLPAPPLTSDFVEQPVNGQQALRLVIDDLRTLDRLTIFSLLFAFVIDFIVISMALCGSYVMSDLDYVFKRVERDTAKRLRKISLDDPEEFSEGLKNNIERLRQATKYSRDFTRVMEDMHNSRSSITLHRGPETIQRLDVPIIASRLDTLDIEDEETTNEIR